jgi:hypothetical protein
VFIFNRVAVVAAGSEGEMAMGSLDMLGRALDAIDLLFYPGAEAGLVDENFDLWLLEQCAFRDGCCGGIAGMYRDYFRWRDVAGKPIAYSSRAFRMALAAEGFRISEVGTFGPMVYGLVLRCDLSSCGIDPPQLGELGAEQTGAFAGGPNIPPRAFVDQSAPLPG